MKYLRLIGLCLMAVFAMSAVAASSASAGELLVRIAHGGSVAGVTFLSVASLARLEAHNGEEIHCKDAFNHGLFLSSTLGDILIQFLGCTAGGQPCKTSGAGKGEIHLPLETTLFHIGLAHLTLSTGGLPAALILLDKDVKIECGEPVVLARILVEGAVIGAFRLDTGSHGPLPLNEPFSTALLSWEQENGLQHLRLFLMPGTTGLTSYDLLSSSSLNGNKPELSGQEAKALLYHFLLPNGKEDELELVEP